jgi:transcription elongation GreA/GreB family factor
MNEEAIEDILVANPKLKHAREELAAMKPGSFCVHRSWGFGRIADYDASQKRLLIDFESGKQSHPMDPAFCVGKLEVLPEGHILVQSRLEPEVIQDMLRKRPVDLIIRILANSPTRMVSSIEIERQLGYLMDETKARKWWTATRKALAKDPRIAVPVKKTEPYQLREEPVTPEEEIMEEFYATQQSKQKILLAERLFQASNDKSELKKYLPDVLRILTDAIIETRILTQAERLHGVWVRNDLARDTHTDVESLVPTSASIIMESEDKLIKLAQDLPHSYYPRFLDLLTRVYPEKWEGIIIDLVKLSEGKFTNECNQFLVDRKKEELLAKSFDRWLNDQTIRGPILLWMLKNRTSRKYGKLVQPFINARLLKAVFFAIDFESLQNASARRIPLADAVIDDDRLIPEILSDAEEETARDLAQTLILNQGFEDLTKKSLLVRFIRVYPSIQDLVYERESAESKESGALLVSAESLERRKREYDDLVSRKIPENKKAIEVAREHGDLRENAEYKMAREDQTTLMALKGQFESELSRVRVTDFSEATNEEVSVGSVVFLKGASGNKVQRFSILGVWDGNPEVQIISYKTPLAQSLIGRRVGDTVDIEVEGTKAKWTLQKIARWVDQAP